ncbi:DUF3127 domain-containing protein [Parabacteroides sp. ZJ-118]|uniref:DUF3127 domain-containing protein n=1 Tax=Parabacteroides sp. ZJ-118 TaxID=2709398 RepID=UPI0013EB7685|nr:DUF3127 domain-containing protein [Parabacteroides sp. ZJ-118]
MEIAGKIIQVLPEVGGISKAGNEWKKQEYVLETHDQYPRKVCFQIFGADRIAQAAIQPGEEVTVSFDIDSREYQGRWFTSINAWKVDRPTVTVPQTAPASAPTAPASSAPDFGPANPIDDLPF